MQLADNGSSDSSCEVMSSLQSGTIKEVLNLKSEQSKHADHEENEEKSAV